MPTGGSDFKNIKATVQGAEIIGTSVRRVQQTPILTPGSDQGIKPQPTFIRIMTKEAVFDDVDQQFHYAWGAAVVQTDGTWTFNTGTGALSGDTDTTYAMNDLEFPIVPTAPVAYGTPSWLRIEKDTTGTGWYTFSSPPANGNVHGIIIDAEPINGAIRAIYTVVLGHWDMTDPSNGGTWVYDDIEVTAFNSAEDMNTFTSGDGTVGTGNFATQSDGTINGGSCKFLFLPVGFPAVMTPRGVDANGNTIYTIINAMNSAQ